MTGEKSARGDGSAALAFLKHLGRDTKIGMLVSEARAGRMTGSEIAVLAVMIAAGPDERDDLLRSALEVMTAAGVPEERTQMVREAVRLSTGGAALSPPAERPKRKPVQRQQPPKSFAQRTQAVAPAFKIPFEPKEFLDAMARGEEQTAAPPAEAAPAAQTAPSGETVPAREAAPAAEGVPAGGAGTVDGQPTVLLADDDDAIRRIFKTRLDNKGFNVLEAADGLSAWKMLESDARIDAIVLDMKMPGMHGLDVLTRLANSGRIIPVVICTAYDQVQDEFAVGTYPKLRFLTKPVDTNHLAEVLINLLAERD